MGFLYLITNRTAAAAIGLHCFIQFPQPLYTLGFISGIQINVDDPISFVGLEGRLDND
jgi:hypothetical protein